MGHKGDSGRAAGRPIGEAEKARFVAAVAGGASLKAAAAAGGATLDGFYGARKRDAAFKAAWQQALDASAGAVRIVPNNNRRWQRRKMRNVRFNEARQEVFLAYMSGTCDFNAAAAEAGVDESTVYKRIKRDAAFAAEVQDALERGYVRLEAEAVRQLLAAQARLRIGVMPAGEISDQFERVMRLLERWDRRSGRVGLRAPGPGRQQSCTFEEAMTALDRKVEALGYRVEEEDSVDGASGSFDGEPVEPFETGPRLRPFETGSRLRSIPPQGEREGDEREGGEPGGSGEGGQGEPDRDEFGDGDAGDAGADPDAE
jgi:hypothetical protein